jgi:hypothetical protein
MSQTARNRRRRGAVLGKASTPQGRLEFFRIADLTPDPRNPRIHDRAQILAIARSIQAFGFNAPILIDKNGKIIAGHGRYEAAKLLGLTLVPVIRLEHLTEAQARAYMLADNKLTDRSTYRDDGSFCTTPPTDEPNELRPAGVLQHCTGRKDSAAKLAPATIACCRHCRRHSVRAGFCR